MIGESNHRGLDVGRELRVGKQKNAISMWGSYFSSRKTTGGCFGCCFASFVEFVFCNKNN